MNTLKFARLWAFLFVTALLAACGDPPPLRLTPAELDYVYSHRYSATATSYSTVVSVVTTYATATVTSTQSH